MPPNGESAGSCGNFGSVVLGSPIRPLHSPAKEAKASSQSTATEPSPARPARCILLPRLVLSLEAAAILVRRSGTRELR